MKTPVMKVGITREAEMTAGTVTEEAGIEAETEGQSSIVLFACPV